MRKEWSKKKVGRGEKGQDVGVEGKNQRGRTMKGKGKVKAIQDGTGRVVKEGMK